MNQISRQNPEHKQQGPKNLISLSLKNVLKNPKFDKNLVKKEVYKKYLNNPINYLIDSNKTIQRTSKKLIKKYGKRKLGFAGITSVITGMIQLSVIFNYFINELEFIWFLPVVPRTIATALIFSLGLFFTSCGLFFISLMLYNSPETTN